MSTSNASLSPLDSSHCRAICEEVGERLRILLDREPGEIPSRLQRLLDRLGELDRVQAPSIVPALEDMPAWSPAA